MPGALPALWRRARQSQFSDQLTAHLLAVAGSKVFHSALAFIYAAIIAKTLGPAAYGLLAFSFAVTAIVAELTGYGLETTLVRLAAPAAAANRHATLASVSAVVFWLKFLVNGAIAVAAWLLADPVARLLGESAYRSPLAFGALGALGFSLWRFVLAVLQSQQSFGRYALVQGAVGTVKIAMLALLLLFARLDLSLALIVHVGSFLIGFLVGFLILPPGTLALRSPIDRATCTRVLSFAKWVVAGSSLSILNSWLGVLLLGYFVAPRIVGQYAAAHQLIMVCEILTVSLNTVLLPIASRIRTESDGPAYVRKALRLSIALSAVLFPIYIFADPLITLVYSPAFESSARVFRVLFWGYLVSLNVHPILLILYAKDRPGVIAGLELAKLLLSLLAYALLIPRFHIFGAALATTLSRIVGATAGIAIVYRVLTARALPTR